MSGHGNKAGAAVPEMLMPHVPVAPVPLAAPSPGGVVATGSGDVAPEIAEIAEAVAFSNSASVVACRCSSGIESQVVLAGSLSRGRRAASSRSAAR